MRQAATRIWALTAVAALLTSGPFTPAARASCGDYVTISHGNGPPAPHDRPQHHSDGRGMPGQEGQPGERFSARPAHALDGPAAPRPSPCPRCPNQPAEPGKAPCRGPACSHGPMPLPVPTTAGEGPQDHWACWQSLLGLAASESVERHCLRDRTGRVHHVFPVYHPPRPA